MKGESNFRGFLVQARTMADDSPVGVFMASGGLKLSACTPPEVEFDLIVPLYSHYMIKLPWQYSVGCLIHTNYVSYYSYI